MFDLNFNRAELKIAEALQLLSSSDHDHLFSSPLLALDVGAAPGGWTGHLASLDLCPVSVIAVDPGTLDPQLLGLKNIKHLACKAELVSGGGGEVLRQEAETLVGGGWRRMLRLLVCDANLDIRDTLRELVLPLTHHLTTGDVVILTLKLGRRVGVEGVVRKEKSARDMLTDAGFSEDSIKFEWLFGNSKNERTIFARKL